MTNKNYRPDIDGLRAVAVLAVVLFHAFPTQMPGGFIGVDIFFVISGYLITGILLRNVKDSKYGLFQFYRKRVRRIFPALIIVLLSTLSFGFFVLLPEELHQIGFEITSGALFFSNFYFMNNGSYFDVDALSKPLLHLWSLGVEEQFYIFWPLILYAIIKTKKWAVF